MLAALKSLFVEPERHRFTLQRYPRSPEEETPFRLSVHESAPFVSVVASTASARNAAIYTLWHDTLSRRGSPGDQRIQLLVAPPATYDLMWEAEAESGTISRWSTVLSRDGASQWCLFHNPGSIIVSNVPKNTVAGAPSVLEETEVRALRAFVEARAKVPVPKRQAPVVIASGPDATPEPLRAVVTDWFISLSDASSACTTHPDRTKLATFVRHVFSDVAESEIDAIVAWSRDEHFHDATNRRFIHISDQPSPAGITPTMRIVALG